MKGKESCEFDPTVLAVCDFIPQKKKKPIPGLIIVAFKPEVHSELILHHSSMLVYTLSYSANRDRTWHDFQGQANVSSVRQEDRSAHIVLSANL